MRLGLGLGVSVAPSVDSEPSEPALPSNTVAPTIDDATPIVGTQIHGTAGTWTGTPTLAYQWERSNGGGWSDVSGGIYLDYTVTTDDIGYELRLREYDSASAATPAYSEATAIILSNDTSLSTFTVNGETMLNSGTLILSSGSSGNLASLEVVVIPNNFAANVSTPVMVPTDYNQDTPDAAIGFDCTAADGETVTHYNFHVHVASDTSLTTFLLDGNPADVNTTVNLVHGTEDVWLTIVPAAFATLSGVTPDPDHRVHITSLHDGDNIVSFRVTGGDGVAFTDYTFNLHVLDVGLPEISQVVVSLGGSPGHDYSFRMYRAGAGADEQVAFVLDAGASKERAQLTIGAEGSACATGSAGLYVVLCDAVGRRVYWFYTGTEFQPDVFEAVSYARVDVSAFFNTAEIATALYTAIGDNFSPVSNDGNPIIIQDVATGPRTNVTTEGGVLGTVTTLIQGRDAASAIGGVTTRMVSIGFGDDDYAIASAIASNANGEGWSVSASGNTVTFVDSVVGPRTDGVGGTGFGVSVSQQGRDPI